MALITDAYRKTQEQLHATTQYGTASIQYAPIVAQMIEKLQIQHLLDYGCGKSMNLARNLKLKPDLGYKLKYQAYDPGVANLAGDPTPAQMVACIDVLEHIEPDCLDEVLDHLKRLTEGVLFATVACGPARKMLSDGRNAHLIQEPMKWWLPKLWERFDIQTVQMTGAQSFYVIAYALSNVIEMEDGTKAANEPELVNGADH